jgi:glycine cleavage system H lipoate-binding protein
MTVVLVLAVFLLFALADFILSRGKAPHVAVEHAASPALEAAVVDGFTVSENVRYHAGHAWCAHDRKHFERVGIDQFAAALVGRPEKVQLPKPGQWIRQGQKAWAFSRNGEKVEMVSPVEGEVIEVNTEVAKNPALLREDPYGRGWLFVVHVPDEDNTARNLLPKSLVSNWMRTAVEALYARQPQLAGATAADGGAPVADIPAALPNAEWSKMAREFFLTR